jgi:hypothetical protein
MVRLLGLRHLQELTTDELLALVEDMTNEERP